jgi:hypothetical protein
MPFSFFFLQSDLTSTGTGMKKGKLHFAACLLKKVCSLPGPALPLYFRLVFFVDGTAQFFFNDHDPIGQHVRGDFPGTAFLVHGEKNAVAPLVRHIHIVLHIGAVRTVEIKLTVSVAGFYDLRKMDTHFRIITIKRKRNSEGNNRLKSALNNVKSHFVDNLLPLFFARFFMQPAIPGRSHPTAVFHDFACLKTQPQETYCTKNGNQAAC